MARPSWPASRRWRSSGAEHFIFRTSWVFGARGENFLRRILQLALEREELKIVDDQVGSPTWSRTLASLAAHAIQKVDGEARVQGITPAEAVRPMGGMYHACSTGFTTWFGFASEFLQIAQRARPERSFARLLPIPSSAYPTPAARPKNSRMNGEKLARALEFEMPSWQDATSRVMEEWLSEN